MNPKMFPGCLAAMLAFASACEAEVLTNLVPVADTSLLESNPDNNLGGLPSIPAGTTQQGRSRVLLKFDVSELPAGAVVTAAELSIVAVAENFSQHPGSIFALSRLLRDWGEGAGSLSNAGDPAKTNEATWNNRFHPATPWSVPGSATGADYAAVFSATNFIDTLTNYTFGSTTSTAADVQLWLDQPGTNFGWILISQSEATAFTVRRFASREDVSRSPVLTVHYTLRPVLTSPSSTGQQLHFSFTADSNRTYTVEVRNSLTAGGWATLTNVPAQATSGTVLVSDSLTPAAAFYRVRSP